MPPAVALGGAALGLGIMGERKARKGRKAARADIAQGAASARQSISGGYPKAQGFVREAQTGARREIQGGFRGARENVQSGYGSAINRAGTGYGTAAGRYKSPEMVQTREELIARVLGQGGFGQNTLEQMKAGAREEYGTGAREAIRNVRGYFGESGAGGMGGESIAMALSSLGGRRGKAIRDIDIQNAMLQEKQQTGAIGSLQEEAGARAGIDMRAGDVLAGLEERRGGAMAGLGTQEAQILADIESQTGLNLANLTTEEAIALANIATGKAAQTAQMRNTRGYLPEIAQIASAGIGAYGAMNAPKR